MEYVFDGKAKRITFILMAIGLLSVILGFFGGDHASQRVWTSILISGFFFFGIGLTGTFFLAVQYAAESGWPTVLKRIFEGVAAYLPIGSLALVLVFIAASLHWNHIYHWMDAELYDPSSEHYDQIIAHKQAYLNLPFWWIRTIAYLGVYIWFTMLFRKRSLMEDEIGADQERSFFLKNQTLAAVFLVFFGYTSVTASWDWVMSIDTHWFSTIFGWYIFSGMWISGMVMMTLLVVYLKSKGLMDFVNDSHIHDMGKWVFAISFLWTYLFFCQFMLYWYSNIPEEVAYYQARIDDYSWIFWGSLLINFVFPMLLLMSKDAKRNLGFLTFVGVIIFFGHWLDVFMIITPGAMKDHGVIGLVEIGTFLGFLGLFLYIVLDALSKRPLLVKNHPMLEESLHHHIN
ncbi:MAG: quinol:cytochrome C oxidoreductase [Salibacteraceae bacterium]